jgi:DNA-binding XRE family transcriptional regulator
MTGKQLKTIRVRMGLTQYEFADRVKMTRNSIARMERDEMIVTPPMELLITFVAREGGVETIHAHRTRRHASSEPTKGSGIAHSESQSGKRTGKDPVQRRGRSRLPKKSD